MSTSRRAQSCSALNARFDFAAQDLEINGLGQKRFSAILQCFALGLRITVSGEPDKLTEGSQSIDFILRNTDTGEQTVYRSQFMGLR